MFLVDTGSDLSLCKERTVAKQFRSCIHKEDICMIKGVGNEDQQTLGTVDATLKHDFVTFSQKLHIVNNDFPIFTDGILGRDFFTFYKCKLDYESWLLTTVLNDAEVTIPMHFRFPTTKALIIPPRVEMIQAISLDLEEDSVIKNQELAPGVFLANCIVPRAGIKHVKILNTNQKPVSLGVFKVAYEPLSEYGVYDSQGYTPDITAKRVQTVKNAILDDLKNAPPEGKNTISDICAEFHDVFHLDGDPLTANNFYEQKIDFTDKTPVYIKNHRPIRSQRPELVKHVKDLLRDGIVEPSVSPYNNPVFLVPKTSESNEKRTRMVLDFRALNEK